MNISEKILHSDPYEINIYKEGVFWIAYEQSAYAVSQVKTLKPTKKYIKTISQETVSVGFPDTVLRNVLELFEGEKQEAGDNRWIIRSKNPVNISAFEEWKQNLLLFTDSKRNVSEPVLSASELSIIEKIKSFPIATSTPLGCMTFLSELQKMI